MIQRGPVLSPPTNLLVYIIRHSRCIQLHRVTKQNRLWDPTFKKKDDVKVPASEPRTTVGTGELTPGSRGKGRSQAVQEEPEGAVDFWKDTIWQRNVQYMVNSVPQVFVQRRTLRLYDDDDNCYDDDDDYGDGDEEGSDGSGGDSRGGSVGECVGY